MKNAWASRSSIQSIPRIISVNANGSCSGSGRLSGAWLSKDRRRACRALQVARKCSRSSFPELQSLHVVFPVGPPSLLTLNLAASHSNPWQPRRSSLKLDLVVRCSISAECVTFQCGAGALGLVQYIIRGSRSLFRHKGSGKSKATVISHGQVICMISEVWHYGGSQLNVTMTLFWILETPPNGQI